MNAEAAEALQDPEYRAGLESFGRELSALLDPMWEREVACREPAAFAEPAPDASPPASRAS
jgi:hypothetical protein